MSFDLLGSLGSPPPEDGATNRSGEAQCSRKACRNRAAWALKWNNPRVHTPERRKIWLACDEHREWLSEYLDTRGFLKDVVPFADLQPASDRRQSHHPNQNPPQE